MSTESIIADLNIAIATCEDAIWELDKAYGEYAPDEILIEGKRLMRSIDTLDRMRESLK